MPWHHHVKNAREIFFQPYHNLANQTFLPGMRASRQKDRSCFSDAEFREGLAEIPTHAAVFPLVVKFYAARADDFSRIDSQCFPALRIGRFLNAEKIELIEYRSGQRP